MSLALWQGLYEGSEGTWLRWRDEEGVLVATGAELAAQERVRAEQERTRAERLAAKLRELGVDPDSI